MAKTIHLIGPSQLAYAHRCLDEAPAGWVMKLGEETRRDVQNRKLWPMLADIRKQVPEMAVFSADDIKLRFLHLLGTEMRYLPEIEGQGFFPVGLKSSTLTVAQFGGLLELLYAFGAQKGVIWSGPQD